MFMVLIHNATHYKVYRLNFGLRGYVSWRACALRFCKLLSTVKILLFLTRDFLHVLCHVQGSEFREVNKRNVFR